MRNKLIGIILIALSFSALAKTNPIPRAEDARIREVSYNPTQVVEIPTTFGVATTIEYGNETIQTVTSGDTIGWQIIPMQNRLFIKPAERGGNAVTNVTVITNKRNYYYSISDSKTPVYVVRYLYPELKDTLTAKASQSSASASTLVRSKNKAYAMAGSPQIQIKSTYDDGQFTYFEFNENQDLPVIYAMNAKGYDELVNTRKEGKYLVAEKIARMFTARTGTAHKCIKNLGYL